MGPVLVTGAAGFIGAAITDRLLADGVPVVGVDSLNAYYDPALKQARLARLEGRKGFTFHRLDLAQRDTTAMLFALERPTHVIHLAAQAGVRYSLEDPHAYIEANITGFLNVLEGCRATGVAHLTYASSSSVYGADRALPFATRRGAAHPVSLYGATKRSNELMAHCYSHLFGLPTTGLRFFTVYGPWGRPDMALFRFTEAILAGRPIEVYGEGRMARDFTYIDDIVEGVVRVSAHPPTGSPEWDPLSPDPGSSAAPFKIYNIGNAQPVPLMRLIATLERELGVKAVLDLKPMQPGDVVDTFADVDDLATDLQFRPNTSIEDGVARFVAWYRAHYGIAATKAA